MELTRRRLLELGGAATAAALLRGTRAAAQEAPKEPTKEPPAGATKSLLGQRHLEHGLDLLCSAHATDAFYAGHSGGAVISACYLVREEELEAGAAEVIAAAIDRWYPVAPCPFPPEEAASDGVAKLLESMEENVDALVRDGHDVIFLSLALRALHDLPDAATPARLDALRRTLRSLEPRRSGKHEIAIPEPDAEFAAFVLEEFLGSTEGGPGQGYSGHLLTHGRAILDLRALGHEAFAKKCLHAYGLALAKARPTKAALDWRAERASQEFIRPDRKAYWERRVAAGTLELGHLFKYPYGFFGLRRRSANSALNDTCTANSFRLFKS